MKSLSDKALLILLSVLLLAGTGACGLFRLSYSFTGGNIHPEAKTISIAEFPNKAALVQPSLSQTFTEALQTKFITQTRLNLVIADGDYSIEGEIVDYSIKPQAIQGNETAALNRLSVTVNVRFYNRFDEKQNFEQRFTRFMDYPSSVNLVDVEESLISTINEALVDDIFNRSVVNW
jgi:hypothetical protein